MIESIKNLVNYRYMINNLVKREVRGRYKGSILGFLWNFLTPLIQILVYIMVFTTIFRSGLENYSIFLISGMIFWIWFSESMSEGSGIMVGNSEMLKKIYFPRIVLPISIVLSKMVNFFIMLGLFLIVIAALNYGVFLQSLLYLPIIIVISFFFILGCVLIVSSIDVYFRDVQYITNVLLMAWIWITPIMYTTKNIDDVFINTIISINPLTYFTYIFQDIFYWKCLPDPITLLVCLLITIGVMIIGLVVFEWLEKDFAEVL